MLLSLLPHNVPRNESPPPSPPRISEKGRNGGPGPQPRPAVHFGSSQRPPHNSRGPGHLSARSGGPGRAPAGGYETGPSSPAAHPRPAGERRQKKCRARTPSRTPNPKPCHSAGGGKASCFVSPRRQNARWRKPRAPGCTSLICGSPVSKSRVPHQRSSPFWDDGLEKEGVSECLVLAPRAYRRWAENRKPVVFLPE